MALEVTHVHPREYLELLWRRRWTVFTVLVVVFLGMTIYTFRQKPRYCAKSLVYLETQSTSSLSLEDLYKATSPSKEYFQTQAKIITSREMIAKLFDQLGLWSKPGFTVENFLKALNVERVPGTSLLEVSFEGTDPHQVAEVVNTLVQIYLDEYRGKTITTAKQLLIQLAKETEQLREKLATQEQALYDFKVEHDLVYLDDKTNPVLSQWEEVNTRRLEAEKRIREFRLILEQVETALGDPENLLAVPYIANQQTIQELTQEERRLDLERLELSKQYKPGHFRMTTLEVRYTQIKEAISKEIEQVISHLQLVVAQTEKELQEIHMALEAQKRPKLASDELLLKYNALKRERDATLATYDTLVKKIKEVDLIPALAQGVDYIKVIESAEVPKKPVKPKKLQNILLGLLGGLLGGVVLSFFLESLDVSLRTQEDLERFVKLPYLGNIPYIPGIKGSDSPAKELVCLNDEPFYVKESYKVLRTAMNFSLPQNTSRAIIITSALPQEGKTQVCVNLAITSAQAGNKVLLVDSDLRHPRLDYLLVEKPVKGLSNILIGEGQVEKIIQETKIPNLYFIPAGTIPPNPSELLSTNRMKDLVTKMKSRFDYLLFDTPPLLTVTDTSVIAHLVDGVILLVKFGATSRYAVTRSQELLLKTKTKILGVVLNQVSMDRLSYGRDYYPYHYYPEKNKTAKTG